MAGWICSGLRRGNFKRLKTTTKSRRKKTVIVFRLLHCLVFGFRERHDKTELARGRQSAGVRANGTSTGHHGCCIDFFEKKLSLLYEESKENNRITANLKLWWNIIAIFYSYVETVYFYCKNEPWRNLCRNRDTKLVHNVIVCVEQWTLIKPFDETVSEQSGKRRAVVFGTFPFPLCSTKKKGGARAVINSIFLFLFYLGFVNNQISHQEV